MSSEIPIFMQIRNEIILGISKGMLKYNERLPSVRQLAEEIGVNMMTVSKAYTILKNEGYIEIDRRKGAIVKGHLDLDKEFYKSLFYDLSLLIAESKAHGLEEEKFHKICNKLYNNENLEEIK
jgi:DNA-binding transcriptional regulator YhcF (GntR family)